MKIKHFQGYGTVTATKLSQKKVTLDHCNCAYPNLYGQKATMVVIRVQGNHEYGLERDDKYDVYNWLLKRFCRNLPEFNEIKCFEFKMNDFYQRNTEKNIEEEVCDYSIVYLV